MERIMDLIIVVLILIIAVFFTVRRFIRICKGKKNCKYAPGCSCCMVKEKACTAGLQKFY
jgi:flagellar biogenesis protein FliO